MQGVKHGDIVTVTYEGLLANGEVFESSKDTGPLQFQVGDNTVLPTFEQGVLDMKKDETKTIQVQPEEAYGPKLPELIQTIDRKNLGDKLDPKPGMVLGMDVERDGEQKKIPAMITEVLADTVTVDFNHPLAGQVLNYQITVEKVEPPPEESTADDENGKAGSCPGCQG